MTKENFLLRGDEIMSQININNLSFQYDTHGEDIFKNVSFCIDTDWKLGLNISLSKGVTFLGQPWKWLETLSLPLQLGKKRWKSIVSCQIRSSIS